MPEKGSEMVARGYNGRIKLLESSVLITREGWPQKGSKEIQLASITAVELKPAGIIYNGYIRFAFAGAIAPSKGLFLGGFDIGAAINDENAIVFTQGQQQAFTDLKREIERRISERNAKPSREDSILDQLERLADLRSKGVLNEEEFNQQKKRLLEGNR